MNISAQFDEFALSSRRMFLVKRFQQAVVAAAVLCAACASTDPALLAAKQGDLKTLEQVFAQRASEKKDGLRKLDWKSLSQSLLARDLSMLSGQEGVTRVNRLQTCARSIREDLHDVAVGNHSKFPVLDDDVRAASASLLLRENLIAADSFFQERQSSNHTGWLAVATMGAVHDAAYPFRAAQLRNDHKIVRLGAIWAARTAATGLDVELLLDAVQHETDGPLRLMAIRALARVAPRVDRLRRAMIVESLAEFWAKPLGEEVHTAIIHTLASKPLFYAGGMRLLSLWSEQRESAEAIESAGVLLHMRDEPGLQEQAANVLERALSVVPIKRIDQVVRKLDLKRSAHFKALSEATSLLKPQSIDLARSKVLMAFRLAQVPKKDVSEQPGLDIGAIQKEAVAMLQELSKREDDAGARAARALLLLGYEEALVRTVAELGKKGSARFFAAEALLYAKHPEELRSLLIDADLDVRMQANCRLLAWAQKADSTPTLR